MPERSVTREWIEALIVAAIFLGFSNTFVLKTFYIPSGSMEDTLLVGDHLIVNRFIYGATLGELEKKALPERAVERGDIVIFRAPEEPELDLVKRCIGVAGDRVEVHDRQLVINGTPVDEAGYVRHKVPNIVRPDFPTYVVPPDHLFCLGDNRDYSKDSRVWGPVPLELVKGRAFLIYWSNGGETPDGTWTGMKDRLAMALRTAKGFPTNTRWSRTFQLIR